VASELYLLLHSETRVAGRFEVEVREVVVVVVEVVGFCLGSRWGKVALAVAAREPTARRVKDFMILSWLLTCDVSS